MRQAVRTLLVVALAACVATPLAAGEGKEKAKAKGKRGKQRTVQVVRVPKTIELNDAQKEQVVAINKEFGPKLAEISQKQAGILTDEQKTARREAYKSAKESKLKGKELKDFLAAELKLTDEQQKQMADVQNEMRALRKEAMEKFQAILTEDQKAKIKSARKPGKRKKPAKAAAAE